jgi:hypothetical protein
LYAGTSREPVTEWDAQIKVGAMGQGKSMKRGIVSNFMNKYAHKVRQKFPYNYLT